MQQKQQSLQSDSQQHLQQLLTPLQQQLSSFQQQMQQQHNVRAKEQGQISSELKHVMQVGLQMNEQAQALTKALKGDNKLAGNWGELLLEKGTAIGRFAEKSALPLPACI